MSLLSHLKVKITFNRNIYKASSDAFPKCYGTGSTESEALEKLSASISRYIAALVKNTFNNLLKSERYTELILDTNESNSQERIYPLDSQTAQFTKSVFVKVKAKDMNATDEKFLDIQSFVKQLDKHKLESEDTVLEKHLHSDTDTDADNFVFGFPLSFN